jgi:hypothetical protein
MRVFLMVLGVLLIVLGVIWLLQGINVLPGSPMTGQSQWAIYGGLAVVAGIVLIALAPKRKGSRPTI